MSLDRSKLRWNGWGWAARKDEFAERETLWTWLASELGMPALLATPPRPLESLTLPPTKLALQDRVGLAAIVGDGQLRDSIEERAFHARGRCYRDRVLLRDGDLSSAPDAVIYPRGSDEVSAVLAFAAEHGLAVVPFGAGTGSVTPERGECPAVLTLDLSDMDRVIAIDPVSQTVEVEAGIYGPALETALKAKGLTLGLAPADFEFTTVGGWIASGAADELIISANLATPSGVITDAAKIALGSQGRLGVITQATLRVRPAPALSQSQTYLFADFARAMAALRSAVQEDFGKSQFHLADAEATRVLSAYTALDKKSGLLDGLRRRYRRWRGVDQAPAGLIAFYEGDHQSIAFQKRRFGKIATRYNGVAIGSTAGENYRQNRFQLPYLRDSLLDRGAGFESFIISASWSQILSAYDAMQGALNLVLREAAPRDDAKGLVLCHSAKATTDRAELTFSLIFPRAIGNDLAQWQTIVTAARAAAAASGAHCLAPDDEAQHQAIPAGTESRVDLVRALKKIVDHNAVMRPKKSDD